MEENRLKRYQDKIDLILRRMEEINEWADINSKDFINDERTKLATYKAFQEAIEACMDITAMSCKDLKIVPKDDYINIEAINDKMDFDCAVLMEANGLRNRLVHRYNTMDDLLAFRSIKEILPEISKFVEGIKKWIRNTLKK